MLYQVLKFRVLEILNCISQVKKGSIQQNMGQICWYPQKHRLELKVIDISESVETRLFSFKTKYCKSHSLKWFEVYEYWIQWYMPKFSSWKIRAHTYWIEGNKATLQIPTLFLYTQHPHWRHCNTIQCFSSFICVRYVSQFWSNESFANKKGAFSKLDTRYRISRKSWWWWHSFQSVWILSKR